MKLGWSRRSSLRSSFSCNACLCLSLSLSLHAADRCTIFKLVRVIREQSTHHSCVWGRVRVRESACVSACKRESESEHGQQKHTGKVRENGTWGGVRHTHTHAYARTQRESEMCVCVGSSCKRCPWGRFNSHLSQVGNATPKAQRESFYLGPLLPCWADESIIGTDQLLLS